MKKLLLLCLLTLLLAAPMLRATETENLGIRLLPAAGKMVMDGKVDDWDLSGGVFICGDVENLRDQLACWVHLQYDADNLYVLARWVDHTPMNNPGSIKGDYGFAGDCLQFRFITAPGQDPKTTERTTHVTAWRDRDGKDVIDLAWGKRFDGGSLKDAKTQGAQQAFAENADHKGYAQEIAIPWTLLCQAGVQPPKAGDKITITFEPNFGTETGYRISQKDVFKPGVPPDRVFAFQANNCWGPGTLVAAGKVEPQMERLSDAREFPVHMVAGAPVVDWTGIVKSTELKGFKTLAFTMPEDGYVSMQLVDAQGVVARQLLAGAFYTKGAHEVKWDGLTTPNWRTPGTVVEPGTYTWRALWHTGISLRLKGWAANAGSAPWDGPTGKNNWGGDEGLAAAVASDGKQVYLGWGGAEAGKALVTTNTDGQVQWRFSRQGMSGAELVAVDNGVVYGQNWDGALFHISADKGAFVEFSSNKSTDLTLKEMLEQPEVKAEERANGLAARAGKLAVAFKARNAVLLIDALTGKTLKTLSLPAPVAVAIGADQQVYVISAGTSVQMVDPATGAAKPFISGLENATALTFDAAGRLYVGVRDPQNQVLVYDAAGKPVAAIGKAGGRPLLGAWDASGMRFIQGLAVDAKGQLWVAEQDVAPKRISVWNSQTGAFIKELFGPSSYGALGGAICPDDPAIMVGQGCEWQLDAKTGRATCVSTITRDGMEVSRFARGSNGKLYLAVAPGWIHGSPFVSIFERTGPGAYKLRSRFHYNGTEKEKNATTTFWADQNGDEQIQPAETTTVNGFVTFSGWYMGLTPDLTIYSNRGRLNVTGFTACGAPQYDLTSAIKIGDGPGGMGAAGLGSADGKLFLTVGAYGQVNSWMDCIEQATGKVLWRYPDNFVGVHGSHLAPPPEVGLIRGSYGPCGTATLPAPLGNVWIIPTNCGEWHLMTQDGFYLTRLFQGDAMKISWPDPATPGAILDNVPPGMGGEDFGGSATYAKDGKLYLQAGKTAFWNVEVQGLENVKAMTGAAVTISADDQKTAETFRTAYLQEAAGAKRLTVKQFTPAFTGDVDKDFAAGETAVFKKQDDAAVTASAAWDATTLYLAWAVRDRSPWINAADDAGQMYVYGDTVDFQLGTDPKAAKNRREAALGDLRLSIGNFKGQPTAVLYRKVAATKKPKTFSSGVFKEYIMEFVDVLPNAKVQVKVNPGQGYVVEAAIPLADLGLTPTDGLALTGDFGVTHAGADNQRTRLRSYWSNQHTGIVDDVVAELMLEPQFWGEIKFAK